MKNYKFKYVDILGDNEYTVDFDTYSNINHDEVLLEVDGDLYLENHNGEHVDLKELSPADIKQINLMVENWLDNEQYENASKYIQDDYESRSDRAYEDYIDRLGDN